jgi:predicted kinase
MVTFTLTMGIPGAGKTTYARDESDRHADIVLLSTDIIRTGRQAHRPSILAALERQALHCLATDTSVIIDACSMITAQRVRWRALAHHAGADPHLVVIHCPLETALTRCAVRRHPVPPEVVRDYHHRLGRALRAIRRESWSTITHRDGRGA